MPTTGSLPSVAMNFTVLSRSAVHPNSASSFSPSSGAKATSAAGGARTFCSASSCVLRRVLAAIRARSSAGFSSTPLRGVKAITSPGSSWPVSAISSNGTGIAPSSLATMNRPWTVRR